MEAEAPRLNTEERKEIYSQTRFQVMATGVESGDMKVSAAISRKTVTTVLQGNDEVSHQHQKASAALLSNTVTTGGENDGISHQAEKGKNVLPASDPAVYFNSTDSFLYTTKGAIGIAISPTEGVQEIDLRKMFVMPAKHEFYCPSCEVSIDKVLFCQRRETIEQTQIELAPPVIDYPVRCSECFSYLIRKGKQFFTGLVSRPGSGPAETSIIIPEPDPIPTPPVVIPQSSKGWEILKSVVYGGLAELLASLSVITSAASADATTLSIVALAVANLIGGLFVLGHNLRDLKASQPREEGSETDAAVDKYYELLGKRENHFLHAFVAILSFLIFGLVPPIVYGFSFRESDDKDLKLAVVAGVSLICITLLGIAKAYIQRPNSYLTYFKTILFYVTSGVLASLLTYLAGAAMKRLVEHLGWFEPRSSSFGLYLPEMSIEKTGWGSY